MATSPGDDQERLNKRQTFSLSKSLKEKIENAAEAQEISKARFIREAIRFYLSHHQEMIAGDESTGSDSRGKGNTVQPTPIGAADLFARIGCAGERTGEEEEDRALKAIRVNE